MSRPAENVTPEIPVVANEAEAAAFWDTHSPEDYPADFEEVQVRFARSLIKRGITLKLGDKAIQKVRQGFGDS